MGSIRKTVRSIMSGGKSRRKKKSKTRKNRSKKRVKEYTCTIDDCTEKRNNGDDMADHLRESHGIEKEEGIGWDMFWEVLAVAGFVMLGFQLGKTSTKVVEEGSNSVERNVDDVVKAVNQQGDTDADIE